MKDIKIYKCIKSIIDIVLVVLLLFLSIKKGGFYKTDNLIFNLIVTFIGFFYISYLYIKKIKIRYFSKNKSGNSIKYEKYRLDIIEILLFLHSISYLLPIIFNNYSDLSDSIFEMIRYFNMYIIYVIVKNSDDKKMYINSFLGIVFIECVLGVDGLANRYFLPVLNKFNSGYLTSNNLTRMSATIQYANVFSLLCIFANIYLLDKLRSIEKLNKNNLIDYFLSFIFTSSIILSKSRVIFAILICYIIYIFISKKTHNKSIIGINVVLTLIYTTIFMKLLYTNINVIYILTFSFYMLIILLYFLKDKIITSIEKVKRFVYSKVKNKKVIYVALSFILILYLVLAIYIKIPINISYDVSQNYIERNIYNLNKEKTNVIDIKIKRNNEDSRYKIEILEINEKSESSIIKTYNYYNSITDNFKFEYVPKDDFKNLIVKVYCTKDSISVQKICVNDTNNYIDYLLLPTDMVYRIQDTLKVDLSLKDRIYFTKDAVLLIKQSLKNFICGLGGEGFKNTYHIVKSNNYSSTEVHNVYLQIFVESGVIGFLLFITLVIVSLKKSKFDIIKLLLIIFYITAIFDLNFSYMFVMAIFAMLLALLNSKDSSKTDENNINKEAKHKNIIFIIDSLKVTIFVPLCIILLIILIKSNIAYYMKVPKLDENYTLEQIDESICKQEKRVLLDPYDNNYRKSLHIEYEKYLEILDSKKMHTSEQYNIVKQKMKDNIEKMQINNKYILK